MAKLGIEQVILTACLGLPAAAQEDPPLPQVTARQSYVVLASRATAAADGWKDVVATLREKHDASLIVYPEGCVASTLPELKRLHPRYAAFVAPPTEAGRAFVVAIHRMTRTLDDDPYTDLRWGIVTGYEAADALRIARRAEPLVIETAASSMGPACFKNLQGGFASAETDAGKFWSKVNGGETVLTEVTPDPTEALAHAFNTIPPDVFTTSGHATEHGWQVGYNVKAGQFRHKDGQLFAFSTTGKRYDITSPHPKIYMPVGNCLIGHVSGKDCMATAWMHTGGVHQMFGYTVVTFHGYMGWGTGSYFGNGYSLSEAACFNNQSLLRELLTEFPDQAHIEFDTYDQRSIGRLAGQHKIRDKKLLGHLWDRDTVAFYGDPAWVARHRQDNPAWRVSYDHNGEQVSIRVSVLRDGTWWGRPLAIPFPERLGRIRGIACSHEIEPVVTDDFALLPLMGKPRAQGDTIELTFGAHTIDPTPTSASSPPVLIKAAPPEETGQHPPNRLGMRDWELADADMRRIGLALHFAGENRGQLIQALDRAEPHERADTAFLLTNMPLRDLRELKADFILENVRYARKARDETPWKHDISDQLYRDCILPYANLTEKREPWRRPFHEKLAPLVTECNRPGEAAVVLNQSIYDLFQVKYHATKRPRPDQGPLESIEAGYASCTGLSILLVNACRAVGVPARVAGVAKWTEGKGNHTWVEVWDRGWHCLGASESKALDKVWFGKNAAAADTSDPHKRVYAAAFRRTPLRFPIAWNPYADYIPAIDVSARYKRKFGDPPAEDRTPAAPPKAESDRVNQPGRAL